MPVSRRRLPLRAARRRPVLRRPAAATAPATTASPRYFELPAPSLLAERLDRRAARPPHGVAARDPLPRRRLAIRRRCARRSSASSAAAGRVGGELAADHGRPALTQPAGADRRRIARSSRSTSTASSPAEPAVSIVVPLYKRLDFIEHQLLHFSTDPDFAAAELIYVLDSVEQTRRAGGAGAGALRPLRAALQGRQPDRRRRLRRRQRPRDRGLARRSGCCCSTPT